MYQNTLDEYKPSDGGDKTTALKVDWISKLPKVFCMQFNRVKYEQGNAVKVNTKLNIEQIIFADRFMI